MKSKLIAGLCLSLLGFGAAANTLTVTTTSDEYGSNNLACSLREAIHAAEINAAYAGCAAGGGSFDVIQLGAARYVLTRAGDDEDANASGDLDVVSGQVRIIGVDPRDSVIDAAGLDRVLHIHDGGNVRLEKLTLTGGSTLAPAVTSRNGGGILIVDGAALFLTDAVVAGNQGWLGGGILNDGSLIALRAAVIDNYAGNQGGGLYNAHPGATLINVTVSGNRSALTGGIYSSRGMTLNNVTIARNRSTANSGAGLRVDTALAATALEVELSNSLIADNGASASGNDLLCNNPITSHGNNLIEHIGSGECTLTLGGIDTPRSIFGIDPHLAPLFDYGAGMPVHALMLDSAAIGEGTISGSHACAASDARDRPRALPNSCDIGAYEAVVDFVVGTTNDNPDVNPGNGRCGTVTPIGGGQEFLCSLRAAVQEANATPGPQTIVLDDLTYALTRVGNDASALNGDLDLLSEEIVLIGAGVGQTRIVAQGSNDRLFDLPTGIRSVALLGVQLSAGTASGGGGCVRMYRGNLALFESQVDHCSADYGGGLYAATPSGGGEQILIERSALVQNAASVSGGGAYVSNAALRVRNSTLGSNRAAETGGGLHLQSGLTLLDFASIAGNHAGSSGSLANIRGGGIAITQSAVALARASVIASNRVSGVSASAADCAAPGFNGGGFGGISLVGYNLLGSGAGCAYEGAETPNFLDMDARLSQLHTLQSASGAHAPQPGSLLLDAIPSALCADLDAVLALTDQRGSARPGPGPALCDIGAFEGTSELIFADGYD